MSRRILATTQGLSTWRAHLASPIKHWKRGRSAFETAVSWENADRSDSGLPQPIANLFDKEHFGEVSLVFALVEHNTIVKGGGYQPQSDVWALLDSAVGWISMSVEAKNDEPFGNDETLAQWLLAGKGKDSKSNRLKRWNNLQENLPPGSYESVRYQLLQRCASAVIEARRLRARHAAMVIQAFETPDDCFQRYAEFCDVIPEMKARRNSMSACRLADGLQLSIGWADCGFASDEQVAAVV